MTSKLKSYLVTKFYQPYGNLWIPRQCFCQCFHFFKIKSVQVSHAICHRSDQSIKSEEDDSRAYSGDGTYPNLPFNTV